jgi:type IV pilus assembly protein PilW
MSGGFRMSHRDPRRHAPGFTLIELMVAMLLGLVVVGGVVSVFLANQRSYRTNQALGDVQDSSRIAFEMMARDIRNAGMTGCNNSGRMGNVLNNGTVKSSAPTWWANWNNAVMGYGGSQGDPATGSAFGTAAGSRLSGTESLTLIGGSDNVASVNTDTEPAGNFTLNETSTQLQTGDAVLVCDPDHASLVQISSYADGSGGASFTHAAAGTAPGNCSLGLGYPSVCTSSGTTYVFLRNAQVTKLSVADWYIGANPIGGSSLYRVSLVNTAGSLSTAPLEMVRNVTGMTNLYHQRGNTGFVAATAVTNWALVDAVQVSLNIQSTDQRAGTDVKPLRRTVTSTTTVRNRVN